MSHGVLQPTKTLFSELVHPIASHRLPNSQTAWPQLHSTRRTFHQTSPHKLPKELRIGYVPEHYLVPLHLSLPYLERRNPGTTLHLIPYPSGTGHMINSLRSNPPALDLAIGLTEGWIAGLLGSAAKAGSDDYRIVGQWVDSPLRWAIVTGRDRAQIADLSSLQQRRPIRVGVSRLGSGSHIMASILAQREGWFSSTESPLPLEFIPLGPFADLRKGVNSSAADFFMWEHYTTKPFFTGQGAELKRIGEIYTPWPAWMIVASTRAFPEPNNHEGLRGIFDALWMGVDRLEREKHMVVDMLTEGEVTGRYGEDDAREWVEGVKYSDRRLGVDREVVEGVMDGLKGAGVIGRDIGNQDDWSLRDKIGLIRPR